MDAPDFREILLADLAVELGIVDAASAAKALARRLESGAGSVLEMAPEAERSRLTGELERILAEVQGDARAAVARRGVERAISASLRPEASHALAEAGARIRAPLSPLARDRYVGFLPIGEGGMGVVYLAIDTALSRPVAFKMIRTGAEHPLGPTPTPPDQELVARFLQEAWVTGALEHPGIVPVHELGKTPSGVPYYTMRLVRGKRTLGDAISEAKTLEQRLALLETFLKVCDAVRYAHSRGVVHRDLKPENVAIGEFGEVIVLDWGLAKLEDRPDLADQRWRSRIAELRRETELQTLASALGTPGFMAPEALLGQVDEVDARSDVYSLGAILFRILTGRLPFEVKTLTQYMSDVMKGVEEVPGAPSGLEQICLKALAREREARYADAGELAAAIRRWQGESAVEREVRSLEQEASAAMDAAASVSGDALLRELDRALAVSARIVELSPDHEGARGIRERAVLTRERAIKERERVARSRQLRRVGVVALGVAVLATVAVALLLDARRREAEQAREEAARERDAKGRALDEVLRLADSKKVADLVAEAEELWPLHPAKVPAMAAWLDRARAVLANRPDHEASLARVRARGEEVGGEWRFKTAEDDWRHQVLSDLLKGLDAVAAAGERVEARREAAATLRERSIGAHAAEWDATIAAIAASPRYGGLKITPQLGLIPLGPDRASGLFEFAHVGSGEVPGRDPATGRLGLGDDSAIVLVLLPGGTFRMGAQKSDPNAPNFDPQSQANESPVHEVTLSPYLIGKFEVTQAQWAKLTGGEQPSRYGPSYSDITPRNPVEQVSWDGCSKWLPRFGLALPTEAQWECACRAGTDTPWWCGCEPQALAKAANLSDASAKRGGGPPSWQYDTWEDGYARHAPAGSFLANAFGLHDVIGNVWEWCLDPWGEYTAEPATDPSRSGASGPRVIRGGGWNTVASDARSATRGATAQTFNNLFIGVRPARPLESE